MSFVKLGMMMGFVLAASLALAACGGDSEPQSTTVGQVQVPVATVEYADGGFVPDRVEINQGGQIKFLNRSDRPLWPASNIHPTHQVYPGFDAKGPIGSGEAWVFNFDQVGVWRYHNHLSPTDGGTIVVRGEATAPRTVRDAIDPADLQFEAVGEVPAGVASDLFHDDVLLARFVREYGPASVIKILSENAFRVGGDCHPRAHDLGRVSYTLFGAAAFSLSGHECQSGGYHGATEALFRERGTADLRSQIPLVCGSNLNRFFRHQCIHGVGHGLMAWTNYELLEALEICDRLSGAVDPQSCYSGVFMENVVGGLSGAMGHFTSYLSDDPHFPCDILEDRHVAPCYFYQTSRMVQLFAGDFQQVAVACSQAPATAQRLCFQSMGRDIGGASRKNPRQAIRLCAFVEDSRYHLDCLEGAVQDSFWDVGADDDALTFCGLVAEGDEKRRCYATIVERAGQLYESPDGVRAFCARLEEGYREGCP